MNNEYTDWHPGLILTIENNVSVNLPYAVVILNTPIRWKPQFLLPLWNKATLRYTVDGGSNRWFKWLQENNISYKSVLNPHFVTGDMDSIDVKVLEMIRDNRISTVIVTEDQNETDFTKALKEIKKIVHSRDKQIKNVVVVVDTCGRLDQIMANINTLYKAQNFLPTINIFQLAKDSLSWVISRGKHKIFIPDKLRENKPWCALIPIGEQCDHITTTGLKWNLENKSMKFGDLVSTSNTYNGEPFVTIDTEKCLLWSMGLCGLSTLSCDS